MTKNMRDLMGAAAVCWALGLGAAQAEEGFSAGANGLEFESGAVRATLGGRVHLDAASVDDGGTNTDDEEVRRARLELAVRFGDNWRLRADREFTNGGAWRNLWLGYAGEDFNIKAGNFIAPFSMEDVGSSNDTMFMERSLVQAPSSSSPRARRRKRNRLWSTSLTSNKPRSISPTSQPVDSTASGNSPWLRGTLPRASC